jgi:hypothetical protein
MNAIRLLSASALLILAAVSACGDDESGGGGTTASGGTGGTPVGGGMGGTQVQGGGGSSAGGMNTGGGAVTCQTYCDALAASDCTNANEQYAGGTCVPVCEQSGWPVGTADGADTSNSIGCRQYFAENIIGAMQDESCTKAGPAAMSFTGSACGASGCDTFCDMALAICPAVWGDKPACTTDCGNFAGNNFMIYSTDETMGDTASCRMYHLNAAALDAAMHCPHIAAVSSVCI